MKVLINGEPLDRLPVSDRGLNYGDGLFETMAVEAGRVRHWTYHMQRLCRGCRRLGLPLPDEDGLRHEAERINRGLDRAVLKLVYTAGSGGRGYARPEPVAPLRILTVSPWPDYPAGWFEQGIELVVCAIPASTNPALAGLKHLNRLDSVLARQEVARQGVEEGIMLDDDGMLVEGTMSNLFWFTEETLHTPDVNRAGVAGVTRQRLLRLAEQKAIPVRIARFPLQSLRQADEVFVSNSLLGVCPVRRLGQWTYEPGRRTAALRQALLEEVE